MGKKEKKNLAEFKQTRRYNISYTLSHPGVEDWVIDDISIGWPTFVFAPENCSIHIFFRSTSGLTIIIPNNNFLSSLSITPVQSNE